MSLNPSFTVDVDLANSGQFFACCGLLELANSFADHKETAAPYGWFQERQFHVSSFTPECLHEFLGCKVTNVSENVEGNDDDAGDKSGAVTLSSPFNLQLNWWCDSQCRRMGLKTWSGGQTVIGFIDGVRKALSDDVVAKPSLLSHRLRLADPKPFYFDASTSRNTAIDVGFSTDAFKLDLFVSPATELFALIGLQRFRPSEIEPRVRCGYTTWSEPLPVEIASAVACGALPTFTLQKYEFPLINRTADARYKALGRAQLV